MWFLPSYGRPERLRELLDAPGGWPYKVTVLVNEDDPRRMEYFVALSKAFGYDHPWYIHIIPAGSRCADAHRYLSEAWPDEPFYGLLCDDHWPVTMGWWQRMEEAAEDRYIVTPNGEPLYPKIRNAVAFGGGLVRAMGSLVPCAVKHNYEDNLWDQVAEDFGILRPLADVYVEHRHWVHGSAIVDATYERGSADAQTDAGIFHDWLASKERLAMCRRVAKFLGVPMSTLDPKAVKLSIVVPIQDEVVDIAYHKSLTHTLDTMRVIGVETFVMEVAGGSNVGKARERALWASWQHKQPTHILWVDADMGWDPKLVTRLLSADHEFVAVPGVRKTDECRPCVNVYPEQVFHPHTGFLKVRDVGFAFVLMKASVIEKLCRAYPELRYNAGDQEEYALFLEMIDREDTELGIHGERLSEDISFCRRWTAIGGEIWVDAHASVIHAGRKEYSGRVSDYFKPSRPQLEAAE